MLCIGGISRDRTGHHRTKGSTTKEHKFAKPPNKMIEGAEKTFRYVS